MKAFREIILAATLGGLSCAGLAEDRAVGVTAAGISSDEQAVYAAVLESWLESSSDRQMIDRALGTAPAPQDAENRECVGAIRFPARQRGQQGKKVIAGSSFIRPNFILVDGDKWQSHDPEIGIRQGKSVEAAVTEGMSHSLITLSQISFSADRQDALVSMSMTCGGLCGSGSTLRLHHSKQKWVIKKRCDEFMS